ncbi:MAG: cell envelope integrity protein CreD [Hyphomonadaceae bacterium]
MAELPRLPTRSVGLKFLLICVLTLVMAIPTYSIYLVLQDRLNRYDSVRIEMSKYEGGMQTILGPVLLVPYTKNVQRDDKDKTIVTLRGESVVFPETGDADAKLAAEERKRSIYTIPTYRSQIAVKARFDPEQAAAALAALDPAAKYDWPKARLAMGVSNTVGLLKDITLTLPAGERRVVKPASFTAEPAPPADGVYRPAGVDAGGFSIVSAPVGDLVQPRAALDVRTNLELSGAERFSVAPFAKDTTARVAAQWPHPSFDGGFLPTKREITAAGFTAEWNAPSVRRGIPEVGQSASILAQMPQKDFGVRLTEPTNIYTGVNRALKYSLMFIGLVFVVYFMFEVVSGARAHPAQYIMVGLAQGVFYLLLLAFAEQIGFTPAFVAAAGATVALLSLYVRVVFRTAKYVVPALVTFTLVYALMYVLMEAEDYSLLVGALMSFSALAALMYLTRNVAWYGPGDRERA